MNTGLALETPTDFSLAALFGPAASGEVQSVTPVSAPKLGLTGTFDAALTRTAEETPQSVVSFDSARSLGEQALELGQLENGKTMLVTPMGVICTTEKGDYVALSNEGKTTLDAQAQEQVAQILRENPNTIAPDVPVNFFNPRLEDTAQILTVQAQLSDLMDAYHAHVPETPAAGSTLGGAFGSAALAINPVALALEKIAPAPVPASLTQDPAYNAE